MIIDGAIVLGALVAIAAVGLVARLFLLRLPDVPPPAAPGPDVTRGAPAIVCHACVAGVAGACVCLSPCGVPECERGRPLPVMLPAPLSRHGVWPMPGGPVEWLPGGIPVRPDGSVAWGSGMYDPETEIEQAQIRLLGPYPALAPAALEAAAEPLPPALASIPDDDMGDDSPDPVPDAAPDYFDPHDPDACLCVFGNDRELAVTSVSECPQHRRMPLADVPSVIWTADRETNWDDFRARVATELADPRLMVLPSRLIITAAEPVLEKPTPALLAADDHALEVLAAYADRSELESAALVGTPAPHDPVWPAWSPWCLEAEAEMLAVAA